MCGKYKVAEIDELTSDGSRVIAEVEGREVAVFRHDGEYYALANYCIHQSGPLCEGELSGTMTSGDDGWEWDYDDEEKYVTCPWHGWRFDITTGVNVNDERYRTPMYEVKVQDGDVYVVL